MKKISIIIPAFNEEARITKTLESIPKQMLGFRLEVIVVNDGSTDKTKKIVQKIATKKENITLLAHLKNKGKGAAIKTGMLACDGDFALYMDADNSTTINHLEKFIKKATENDVIIGSRALKDSQITRHQSYYKRLLGKLGNLLIRKILGLKFQDTQCGFKFFNRYAINKIFPDCECSGWGIDFEILKIAKSKKLKIIEIPITWENNPGSKVTWKSYIQTLIELIKVKKRNP